MLRILDVTQCVCTKRIETVFNGVPEFERQLKVAFTYLFLLSQRHRNSGRREIPSDSWLGGKIGLEWWDLRAISK